ncbi:VPS10 domain-containing protein [Saccharicrinis aurantiacus]|uniref:VPS10 domain-containing protein n=1 Tax=Saccharicrinis aurantiacus TaxID=1849719 RepID=UPI000837DEF3|nr:Ig-like domain-containing protein [Saccharicrinis aurantiacus]
MKYLALLIITFLGCNNAFSNETVFVAEFEGNDLSEWESSSGSGTLIFEPSEQAKIGGSYGFHIKFDPAYSGTAKANLTTPSHIKFEAGEEYKISFSYKAVVPDPTSSKASMLKVYDSAKNYVNGSAIYMAYSSTDVTRYETTFISQVTDEEGYVLFTFRNNPTSDGEFYIDDILIEQVIREPNFWDDLKTKKLSSAEDIIWTQFGPGMSGNNKSAFWHPTDPDVLFIGPNMGNSYVSFDRGATYQTILNEDESDFKRGERGAIEITSLDFSRQNSDFGMCTDERNQGIYLTTDRGRTWTSLSTTIFDDIYVDAVAVDPKDDNIWYAGAGQMRNLGSNLYPNSQPLGTLLDANSVKKIWKSTDKGESWVLINSGLADNTGVETLMVDPKNSNVVYASTNTGFYKSTNGGDSWVEKNTGLDYTVLRSMASYYDEDEDALMMIVISNPMWVADGNSLKDDAGGLFRSNDRGESWQKIEGDLAIDLSYFQDNSDIRESYYGVGAYTFDMTDAEFEAQYPSLPTALTNRFNTIEIDPNNPDNLYLNNETSNGSTNNFKPGQVWRSTDGGISWHVCLRNGTQWSEGSSDADYWTTTRNNPLETNIHLRYLHEWVNRDPYDRKGCNFVKFNCDGTVLHTQMAKISLFSYDNGLTWLDIDDEYTGTDSPNLVGAGNSNVPGHGFFQHNAIADKVYCAAGENQLCITTDDGDLVREGAQAVLPVRISSSESSLSCYAIHPHNTDIHYAMFFRQANRGKLLRSIDGGETWDVHGDPIPELGSTSGNPRAHQLHLTIDPVNPDNMYFVVPSRTLDIAFVGDSEYGIGVHKSSDGGATWKQIHNGLPSSFDATKIAIDPNNENTIYVTIQHSNGGLFKSVDNGENWSEVDNTKDISGSFGINDIHFAKNGKVYITSGSKNAEANDGGLWMSDDNMASWTKIFDYPWVFRVETALWDANTIMLSTLSNNNIEGRNAGTYLSKDGGDNWIKINRGNGQSDRVNDLAIDNYVPGKYYASTYGSGWYTATDPFAIEAVAATSMNILNDNVNLKVGEQHQLELTIQPNDATYKNSVVWLNENTNIVSINDNGLLTGLSIGTAKVKALLPYSDKEVSVTVNVDTVTGLDLIYSDDDIKIFPTPTKDKLTVSGKSEILSNSYVNIYALSGETVKQISKPVIVNTNTMTISVGDLISGIYIIEIVKSESSYKKRFVKE